MTRQIGTVLGSRIDALSWKSALTQLADWAAVRESRYVCICNVHSVVSASRDPAFAEVINAADLATPDGAPVAWMLRRLGFNGQERISGPDLMWRYCGSADGSAPIFLYGSTPEILADLQARLCAAFPQLMIAGAYSPPFRALTPEEDEDIVQRINASGAKTVWVGLGCPKQEFWMAEHRGRIHAVMIGVGAAFDFHAGVMKRAPEWMRNNGLEWLHRLCSEPRRLWRRYFVTNTLFIFGALRQLAFLRTDYGLSHTPSAKREQAASGGDTKS